MTLTRRPGNVEVIAKIEKVFGDIGDSLARGQQMFIPLKCKNPGSCDINQPDDNSLATLTNVSFPGRTAQEARRFSRLR